MSSPTNAAYRFRIYYDSPATQFLQIEAKIPAPGDSLLLRLPVWRPGRYELANYAKYVRDFRVTDTEGNLLNAKKYIKDGWCIDTSSVDAVHVKYDFYANQLNAGGCWLDDEQLYVNFVNCILFSEDALQAPYEITVEVPDEYEIACALPRKGKTLYARDYYHLIDSPMIASATLKRNFYQVGQYTFYVWIQGNWTPDWNELLRDFEGFTKAQLDMMGEFPFEEYHFLIQVVPYRFYHGVEHTESTVVVLGPSEAMDTNEMYDELLGVCSHELFHVWNVCRIRPKELFPYDLTRECYFPTGFVVEGITSYYGDLFLIRSGVWKYNQYLRELNKYIKRHFENYGRHHRSLVEASVDLWLDGYTEVTPGRKVSIYAKGALVALILDFLIRKHSNGKASLDDVMRKMWHRFGKPFKKGYSLRDFKNIVAEVVGNPLHSFFADCIEGITPLEKYLEPLMEEVGISFITNYLNKGTELFNFQLQEKEGRLLVSAIVPDSNASQQLRLNDELIAVNGKRAETIEQVQRLIGVQTVARLTVSRQAYLKEIELEADPVISFKEYFLQLKSNLSQEQQKRLLAWLHQSNN
ncbi:MAG: peptidase M61 [Thermonema sp.]|uniref:M61 family metallopeptidase n=1 Tax=Thermonema sp. TaxID=2231181 RepID=UPI0021DC8912|nr:M61 family peptidase [Thermonema sp.]GIV39661.1 MAG: peptidase M61 [Thermonema sp.]